MSPESFAEEDTGVEGSPASSGAPAYGRQRA